MTLPSIHFMRLVLSFVGLMIIATRIHAGNDSEQFQRELLTKKSSWTIRLPKEDKVVFIGELNFDNAGTGIGTMVYPAPNAIGFLAGVITHGLLTESSKNSQKEKLQETANKVLLPYEAILSTYTYKELMQRGLEKTSINGPKKLIEFADMNRTDWRIESVLAFSVTQDQSAIILDNSISIYQPEIKKPSYQNTIRVVSRAREEPDLVNFWTADEGKRLKEESASLFAQSVDIAVNDMSNEPTNENNAYKTIRYLQGKTEKIERAQPIQESCNRLVIKTLRGWLVSVPVATHSLAGLADTKCADAL